MEEKKKKGLSSTQIILIAGIVVIVLAVAAVGFLLLRKQDAAPADAVSGQTMPAGTGTVVLDENNAEDIIAKMKAKAAEGNYSVKMNMSWNFPNGTSATSDGYVANSEANSDPVSFQLKFRDTEEVVYSSPLLQVGEAVKEFKLDKDLDAGTYDCVCEYTTWKDGVADGTVSVAVTVTVAE